MLSGSILASNSTLNNFTILDSLEIYRGEEITFQFRILDNQSGHRYIPASGAVITVNFTDGTNIIARVASVLADDRSMASVVLDEADTALILSGDIQFDVVEGTVTKKGYISNAIRMTTEGC